MIVKWYRQQPFSEESYPQTRYIQGGVITQPFELDGVLYGTYENPAYKVEESMNFPSDSTHYKYYFTENRLVGYTSREYYRAVFFSVVGTTNPDIITDDYITNNDDLDDRLIYGKYRLRTTLLPIRINTGFELPLYGALYLNNGDIIDFTRAGSKIITSFDYDTYFSFGDYTFDVSNGVIVVSRQPGQPVYDRTDFENMVVDFGTTPQHIPKFLYDYYNTNFDVVYENQYTVYNENAVQVAQSEPEQPPIIKTNLLWSVNTCQLALTRADDRVITLTWTNPTPENKVFKGLSIAQNSSEIVIPIGDREVLIEKSTNFYMVYGDYTPPPAPPDPPTIPSYGDSQLPKAEERPLPEGAYNVNCYTNTAEANRVDKTDYLTDVRTIRGVLREPTSVTDMVMTIQYPHYPYFNYIRIPELKRYYFVNDITIINANLYELDLSVDPLMSYKNAILGLTAFVDRNEYLSNPRIIDKKRVIEQGVNIEVQEIENTLFNSIDNLNVDQAYNFVLCGYKIDAVSVGEEE